METLIVERSDELPGLLKVTLNRPAKLNAIDSTMQAELQQILQELQSDTTTRVVILTGAGRAFSAGADISAMGTAPIGDVPRSGRRRRVDIGNQLCTQLEQLDQITIAAINGLAIGGAAVLAACADFRIAAQSAWFSIPELDLGMPIAWGALPRLVRLLGPARTREVVMTCDRFSSETALGWGFVNRVVTDEQLSQETLALAQKLLSKDPLALVLLKDSLRALSDALVPQHMAHNDLDLLQFARLSGARPKLDPSQPSS